ncbi:MAG: hypothetical protein JW700_03005 [Candidatus Aenigmarchaeota archaeon]|nr:hypothetical protein [Candidatus Aenigmarchaeota archaeon]
MSILKSVAIFALSTIFTFALLTLVTTQTIGDTLQKDSLKAFAQASMGPELMEPECRNQCLEFEGITDEILERCIDQCLSSVELRVNETGEIIDNLYEKSIMGQSMDDALMLMDQTVLFLAITAVSVAMILFISEDPLSTIGKDIVSVASVTLLIALLTPELVLLVSGTTAQNMISDYMGSGLERMMSLSIALIIAGAFLVLANYLIKRYKKKVPKKRKK